MSVMLDWASQVYQKIPTQVNLGGYRFFKFLASAVSRFPIVRLETGAEADGQPVSVIAAGAQPWAEIVPLSLVGGSPERTALGSVSLWRLGSTLERLASSVDLVMARVDQISSRLLFGAGYLCVPDWLDLRLAVPQDIGSLYAGNRNRNLKNDLRRVKKNGLTCEISPGDATLEEFHERFYLPFIHERFSRFAEAIDPYTLRFLVRRGGLIWVLRDGQRIAGCIYERQDTALKLRVLGTLDGDYGPVELGAYVALYHTLIEHAQQLGCEEVNLGDSQPLLSDGTLRFKRKWGARLVLTGHKARLLFHWARLGPPLLDMLARTGLVFLQDGDLSAVGALSSDGPATVDDVTSACRYLWTPGLRRLYLCSGSGFEADVEAPSDAHLIDLTTFGGAPSSEALLRHMSQISGASGGGGGGAAAG